MAALNINEIDNLVKKAANEQFKSFLRGNNIKAKSIALGGIIGADMLDIGNPVAMSFLTGASVATLGCAVTKAYVDSVKFARNYRLELLSRTDEFKELKKSYDIYVAKIGNFLKELGVNDTLDIAMLYMEMLYSGFLSVPGQFNYHLFRNDFDMCSSLMGARVASGGAVCRHIASNLIDIYKYLGFPATYLTVKGTDNTVRSAIADRILPFKTNHAVVLVGDRYGKYIVDPTWETIAEFRQSEAFAHIVFNRRDIPMYHVDIDNTVKWQKSREYDDYVKLRFMYSAHFKPGEIRGVRDYARDFIDSNCYRFNLLRHRLSDEMVRVAELEHLLSGYSDRKQLTSGKRLVRK